MLSLYYDPLDPSEPIKVTHFLAILGSQTFKQVTKANPSYEELTSSSFFSRKQVVVVASPIPLFFFKITLLAKRTNSTHYGY